MDPHQRQRLREYEYQLGSARYGFFGADWLTALLLFEALDNDYMYVGDPSSFDDGDIRRRRLGWWGFRRRRLRWGRLLTLHGVLATTIYRGLTWMPMKSIVAIGGVRYKDLVKARTLLGPGSDTSPRRMPGDCAIDTTPLRRARKHRRHRARLGIFALVFMFGAGWSLLGLGEKGIAAPMGLRHSRLNGPGLPMLPPRFPLPGRMGPRRVNRRRRNHPVRRRPAMM